MIEKITIKNVATYDNTGVEVTGLKKVNFVYGANGCGKTTVSNFLYNRTDLKFNHCSLAWRNAISINTLIYNKEFRERNFGKGRLGGVFTLGEATAEEIEIIDKKTEELKVLKAEGVKKRETLNSQEERKH
jgi:wobble nucleotide-excising tRNase